MIIVTGASGQLGRGILERLMERVPSDRIGASVREPRKIADLASRGIRVRAGDFADPQSLVHAFEGATQILMVSSNARAHGGDPLAQHRSAIAAAREAGAGRIVYTSHMAASAGSAFPPMLDHAATELMLQDAGLPWTALRNGFYASSGIALMGDALTTGVIEAPEDGKVAWTAHADLAEAAAAILTDEGRYNGPTPPLTGREALDLDDMAGLASGLLGHDVRRTTIADDEFRSRMAARGTPAPVIAIALGRYVASRDGEFNRVDSTLERLIGRPPVTMRDILSGRIAG